MKAAALAAFLAAVPVFAQAAKVSVQADVVHASTQPGPIEPSLKPMQTTLGKGEQGKKYGSLKKLSTQTLELTSTPSVVKLPNGVDAELSLVALEKGVSTVKLKVAPGETVLKLGKQGSLYQHAGSFENGDLWLVLSQPK